MGAPAAPPLEVTAAESDALRSIVRAGTSEQRSVTRARIVLLAAEGVANTRIAREVGGVAADGAVAALPVSTSVGS